MTKIILAHELLEEGISKSRIAQRLGVSRRTIILSAGVYGLLFLRGG